MMGPPPGGCEGDSWCSSWQRRCASIGEARGPAVLAGPRGAPPGSPPPPASPLPPRGSPRVRVLDRRPFFSSESFLAMDAGRLGFIAERKRKREKLMMREHH
uniref:Uncharacterized protein n=1 Tax=Myotis myotis TaxID=51298 RepID=A0A7J7V3D6_MYOMY|nr:hypothetical protein mMyoMyo1_008411 [Myotis myotis]